jgi:excisionase family DNA binding protein
MQEFYTVEEIADLLKVTRKAVYDWMREGRLEYVQIGKRRRRIGREALEEFLRASRAESDKIGDKIQAPNLVGLAA